MGTNRWRFKEKKKEALIEIKIIQKCEKVLLNHQNQPLGHTLDT